jgi:KDO2-lipid IV(A) lauroyltransferase
VKKIFNVLITIFLLLLGFISSLLSINSRYKYGCFLGNVMRILSRKRYNFTLDNLKQAFPDNPFEWIQKTAKKSYLNLGIVLAEVLALKNLSENDIKNYIHYNKFEMIQNVYSRNRGVVLLSAHFGNWEFLAYSCGLFTKLPVLIIVKPQQNKYSDKILNKYRTQAGNEVISMYQAARALVNKIRAGGMIAMLADQSATEDKDIYVDFFGRPAATFKSPAEIALKFDIPIIMGFAMRNENHTYSVELSELRHDDLEYTEDGVIELTKRHVRILEETIRQKPELWAWQHRRWKHTLKSITNYERRITN